MITPAPAAPPVPEPTYELTAADMAQFRAGTIPEAFSTHPEKIFYAVQTPPRFGTIEPNVSLDLYGDPIFPSMTATDNDRTLDPDLHYLIYGKHPTDPAKHGFVGGVPYDNFTKFRASERTVIRNWDTMGNTITISAGFCRRSGDVRFEGPRGDFEATKDADFVLWNGTGGSSYTGDGTQTAFSFTFMAPLPTDVIVQLNGVTVTTGYTVTSLTSPGGTVTMAVPPGPTDKLIIAPRIRPSFWMGGASGDNQHGNNRDPYTVANDPSTPKLTQTVAQIDKGASGAFSSVTLNAALNDKTVYHAVTKAAVAGRKPLHGDFFLVDGSTYSGRAAVLQDANWQWNIVQYVTNSGGGKISLTGYDGASGKTGVDFAGSTTAPRFTFYGTWAVGNTVDLYVTAPDMSFVKFSHTVPAGGTGPDAIADALRAKIAADSRFNGTNMSGSTLNGYTITVVPTAGEVPATKFMVSIEPGHNLPSGTATAIGGTACWFTTDIGTHADFFQAAQSTGSGGPIYQDWIGLDRCTGYGNYDFVVIANSAASDCNVQVTRCNGGFKYVFPSDISSGSYRLGWTGGAGIKDKWVLDGYFKPRPLDTVAKGLAFSANGGEGQTVTINSLDAAIVPSRPEIHGAFKLTPTGFTDYAPYASAGVDWVHPGESDVYPTVGTVSDIALEDALTSINESIASGTQIGLVKVITDNLGGDWDLSIVGTNVLANQWFLHGRRLIAGKTQFDYETTPGGVATVTIRATLRDSSPAVTMDKTLSFNVNNDVAASGLTLATALGGRSADSASRSSYPFSLAIGSASASRFVLAFMSSTTTQADTNGNPARKMNAAQSIATATDGTISLQKVVSRQKKASGNNWAESGIYIAAVPHDTTGTVTLGLNGAATAGAAAAFVLTGLSSANPFSWAYGDNASVAGQTTLDIDAPQNGVIIVGGYYATPTSSNKRHAGAMLNTASAGTYRIRATVPAGAFGPITWEYSTNAGSTWTTFGTGASDHFDDPVESSGGGATVLVAASFATAT